MSMTFADTVPLNVEIGSINKKLSRKRNHRVIPPARYAEPSDAGRGARGADGDADIQTASAR